MKKQLILFLLFVSFFGFNTQAQKLKKLLQDGDKAYSENDFFGASMYYSRAVLKDSTDIAIQYKYAEASRLNYDFEVADKYYTKVYNADRTGKIYPECVFWIATLKKQKGNYKEAAKLFSKYAKKNKRKKNNYFVLKANQEIAACDFASKLIENPDTTITIVHLDSAVNSTVSEYAPIMVDSVLYFSSLRNGADHDKENDINFNKIYTSIYDSIKWKQAMELDSLLFNKAGLHSANTAFNDDYTKVYTTRCQQQNAQDFICQIYFSELKNGKWMDFQKLPSEINVEGYTNTQPAVGYLGEEEVLFFASNRPNGIGKMDIWYSKMEANGAFGKAINAGKLVNSIDDEITPFYCKPCQELFFSSNWHMGLGGFDIFKSEYADGQFTLPKNLGVPINSNYNDIYFSINSEKTEAFLSSNRKGSFFEEKESCCNDIFMFEIPQPVDTTSKEEVALVEELDSVEVAITQMKELVPIALYFHNDEPDKKTLDTTTSLNYKKTYEDYTRMKDFYAQNYSRGKKGIEVEEAQENVNKFFSNYVDAGMRDLEIFAALLLKVVKENERVKITMMGYCSPLASTNYNVNLAKRRMSSLLNYFTEYNEGVLVPFFNNQNPDQGSITFKYDDIGELKAHENVSDDYHDTKNSIYNPSAALERKIEIIAVSTFSSQTE